MKIIRYWIMFILLSSLLYSQYGDSGLDKNVTVSFKDTPLGVILKIMSKDYQFNYMIGEVGSERLTVNFTNVNLGQALNAILLPHGYHYFTQDSMVVIKKIENTASDELKTFIYQAKFKNSEFLEAIGRQVLSPLGSITIIEQKSLIGQMDISIKNIFIVVKDIDSKLDDIKKIFNQVDVKERQLSIEVKLVERSFNDTKRAGVNWPTRVGAKTMSFPPKDQQAAAGGGGQQQEQYTGWYNFPEINDEITTGLVALDQLEMFLEVAREDNTSKIIANPKIITENNTPAVVNISTSVPVPSLSRTVQGDLITYEEKEVASFIEVLPSIADDGTVSMLVHPRLEEITGYAGSSDFPQPVIARREIKTQVNIKAGEALVIGGLIKETESDVENKVFLLGDIPVLGYLFKHTTKVKSKSDLLIIIIPTIL